MSLHPLPCDVIPEPTIQPRACPSCPACPPGRRPVGARRGRLASASRKSLDGERELVSVNVYMESGGLLWDHSGLLDSIHRLHTGIDCYRALPCRFDRLYEAGLKNAAGRRDGCQSKTGLPQID
jgi:hypothetical protein